MLRDLVSTFLGRLRPDRRQTDLSQEIYGAVVAQARRPVFYLEFGVPDTVTGRFDMLCLHVFLLSNRLAGEAGAPAMALSQEVFDTFAADTDRALRELGIGDTSVPKRKKRLLHGFYGQIDDFAAPLQDGDAEALAGKVAGRFGLDAPRAGRLARYMIAARRKLLSLPAAELARLPFPDPEAVR